MPLVEAQDDEVLVVPEPDVEARTVLLDELVLEEQRLLLGAGDDDLDAAEEVLEERDEDAIVAALEEEMRQAAAQLDFEKAAQLRDRILALKDLQLGLPAKAAGMKGIGARGVLGSGAVASVAAMGRLRGSRRPQQRRRRR